MVSERKKIIMFDTHFENILRSYERLKGDFNDTSAKPRFRNNPKYNISSSDRRKQL